jgi:hypothetical protein
VTTVAAKFLVIGFLFQKIPVWGFDRGKTNRLTHSSKDPKPCKRMSDNENQPPSPSKHTSSVPLSKQTSSVPLKKETVRVTLKAADAPPAVPSATVPMAPPVKPPVPTAPTVGGAPRPPAPAPTIPLRTAGAPTVGGGPGPKAPAPTIPLRTAGAAPTKPGGSPTIALPKATVPLQAPTQPLGTSFSSPSQAATLSLDDDDDGEENEGLLKVLSLVGFIAAVVVLSFQLMTASAWISAPDSENPGDWTKLMN